MLLVGIWDIMIEIWFECKSKIIWKAFQGPRIRILYICEEWLCLNITRGKHEVRCQAVVFEVTSHEQSPTRWLLKWPIPNNEGSVWWLWSLNSVSTSARTSQEGQVCCKISSMVESNPYLISPDINMLLASLCKLSVRFTLHYSRSSKQNWGQRSYCVIDWPVWR